MLKKLRDKFPDTEIFVSSILPRKEKYFHSAIQYVNDFLLGICSTASKFSFIRNSNIKHYMLVDSKHVNDDGFFTLLSNIRYKLFNNKFPYLRARNGK